MKASIKKPSSLKPPRSRFVKASLHLLRLVGFTLGLLVLLLLFHLTVIGLPRSTTHWILGRLNENGIPLRADKITLAPHRGWVLHNVRLFSPDPDHLNPLLQTEHLYLGFWMDRWRALSLSNIDFYLSAKNLTVCFGQEWQQSLLPSAPLRSIQHIKAVVRILPDRLIIETMDADWGPLQISSSGTIGTSGPQTTKPSVSWFSIAQKQAPKFAHILSVPVFETPIELQADLSILPDTPEKSRSVIRLSVDDFVLNTRSYKNLLGRFIIRPDLLLLDEVQLTTAQGEWIYADGFLKTDSGQMEARVKNRLSGAALLSLLPQRFTSTLKEANCTLSGAADFDIQFGPAHLEDIFDQVDIIVHDVTLGYQNLLFEPLGFGAKKQGYILTISDIQGQMSDGDIQGNVTVDLSEQSWEAILSGQAMLEPVGTFVGGEGQDWIHRFSFTNQPPSFSLEMSDCPGDNSFRMDLAISGQGLHAAGIPFDTADLNLGYSNKILRISQLDMRQGNRSLKADVEINLERDVATIDGTSRIPLPDLARIIVPNQETILQQFEFPSNSISTLSGQVDYTGGTSHLFSGTLRANSVHAAGFSAENFFTDFRGSGANLYLTNTVFELLDGTVESASTFDLNFKNTEAPYCMELDVTQVDFQKLLTQITTNHSMRSTGKLSGTFDFCSDANGAFWESTTGRGQVEVTGGKLHDLPVLGGFAKIIQTTLPGFSLFSLTTFYADYELNNGALQSENVFAGGSLLSANARGRYSPDAGLDFTVKAEPLRQTREDKGWYMVHLWAADALKQSTAPLFRLLEMRLQGPLEKPRWRMKALPKEAYEILRRAKPENQP